jgi:hypothetical protein
VLFMEKSDIVKQDAIMADFGDQYSDLLGSNAGHQREAGLKTDYFATYNWTEEWTMGGQTVPMSFWNRPLHAMTDAFTAAGFRISVISEPDSVPEARELFPDMLAEKPSFLCFLFFVLHAG